MSEVHGQIIIIQSTIKNLVLSQPMALAFPELHAKTRICTQSPLDKIKNLEPFETTLLQQGHLLLNFFSGKEGGIKETLYLSSVAIA